MEIVKKNILSVICGVVAVIALIALVWPIGGMYDDDKAVLTKRVAVDKEIAGLISAPRNWPVIPDVKSGEKTALKRFPNEKVIKDGLDIREAVHNQAAKIKDVTATDNRHTLLIPGILPNPKEQRFVFQDAYKQMVMDGAKGPGSLSTFRTILLGTTPPTDMEVFAESERLWWKDFKPQILTIGGKDVNREQIVTDWHQKVTDGLEVKMRLETARKAKLYLEPNWISVQKQMPIAGNGPRETDIWFAQNMLWVQSDLIDAIERLNQNATSVEDATVKHIFHLEVPDEMGMYVLNPNAAAAGAAPAPASPTELPVKVFSVSPTGRVCNPLYDVLQFEIVMNVDASKVALVLTELQRGRLITITKADVSSVDGIAAAENGYVYGNVPVVRVSLRGEEIFLRDWTVPLMPDAIRQMLQVPPTAPAHP